LHIEEGKKKLSFHNYLKINISTPFSIVAYESKLEVLNLFSSTSTVVVLLFASEHRHKLSTRTSAVYKYVKEHYLISKEHQVENP
jgi:hypothetical protein